MAGENSLRVADLQREFDGGDAGREVAEQWGANHHGTTPGMKCQYTGYMFIMKLAGLGQLPTVASNGLGRQSAELSRGRLPWRYIPIGVLSSTAALGASSHGSVLPHV